MPRSVSAAELNEYRVLAQRAEQLDVVRVGALVELAQRRAQPLEAVMREIGWKSGSNGG